jgi:hypothetical protein
VLLAAAAASAAPPSPCAVALDAPLSLRWAPSAGDDALFLRHAGYVAWVTPAYGALDALDSTFVARAALSGDAGAASFENADEFPGFFLHVDANSSSIKLVSAPEQRSASFFLRAGAGGAGCALESVLLPGAFATALAPIPARRPAAVPLRELRAGRGRGGAGAGGRRDLDRVAAEQRAAAAGAE